MNSYWPITIVPVLAKLFATVMEQLMTQWGGVAQCQSTATGWFSQGPQHCWAAEYTGHSGEKRSAAQQQACLLLCQL